MMFPVKLAQCDAAAFGEVNPEKVLAYYDGILSFTFHHAQYGLMFAHLLDDDACAARYILVPVTDDTACGIANGTVPLVTAMRQPLVWVVDFQDNAIIRCWCGNANQLPADIFPDADATLGPTNAHPQGSPP